MLWIPLNQEIKETSLILFVQIPQSYFTQRFTIASFMLYFTNYYNFYYVLPVTIPLYVFNFSFILS